MKLLLVVNPISGGVDKEPFLKEAKILLEKYGINYTIFKTTGKNDDNELKKILVDYQPDKVASVGGDGTTLFTSIALLNSTIPMGIIPLGSANGMATELFVNPKPIEALKDIIMSNLIGNLDIVKVNNTYYSMHIGDVGINAQIVNSYAKDKKRGMTTYAKYFIEELKNTSPFEITVKTNGKTITEKGIMVGICNARKYGTGIPLNLNGNPMDGKFEIVIVKKINIKTLVKAGLSKFNEHYLDAKNEVIISAEKAEITFKKPRLLQLDGEVIEEFDTLNLEILKGAVKLITHTKNLNLSNF